MSHIVKHFWTWYSLWKECYINMVYNNNIFYKLHPFNHPPHTHTHIYGGKKLYWCSKVVPSHICMVKHTHTHTHTGRLCGLVGITYDYRSLPPEFEFWHGHIWRVFHLWFHLITFGGRSAHLAYHVHKSGHKTSIIITITILIHVLVRHYIFQHEKLYLSVWFPDDSFRYCI